MPMFSPERRRHGENRRPCNGAELEGAATAKAPGATGSVRAPVGAHGPAHPGLDVLGSVRVQQGGPGLLEGRAGGTDVSDHHRPAVPSQGVLLSRGRELGVTGGGPPAQRGCVSPTYSRPVCTSPGGSRTKP